MRKVLLGNEAIAWGAVEAGVQVACAYPGTPSTEVLETLIRLAPEKGIYVEWSVNEKAALEVAAGCAYAGARCLVAMKQVGLNVACDPLMTLAYIGVQGALVLVVADDPGPHSSQNEQDTRLFARLAKLPVFDPGTPAEAKEMVRAAFDLSASLKLPVIVRPTTRVSHVCQDVEVDERAVVPPVSGHFVKSPEWVIFPAMVQKKHPLLNAKQKTARSVFSASPFNRLIGRGGAPLGIIAAGVSFNYVMEALEKRGLNLPVLKIGTPYPLPEEPVLDFLRLGPRVLVVEELEPVVEEQVCLLAWRHGLTVGVSGKLDEVVPREGELDPDRVLAVLGRLIPEEAATVPARPAAPSLPVRPPVLCAGCPHRASFYAVKQAAAGRDAVFTGDIGCYTLGNAPPLEMVDTCLCMGAAVNIAAGLSRVEPDRPVVAFLGDSTFFHSGLAGLLNASYNGAGITLVVLDNRTTAMTGHQPHPGVGRTALGGAAPATDIVEVARALGIGFVEAVDPCDLERAVEVAKRAIAYAGPAVVVMRRECVAGRPAAGRYRVAAERCTACHLCVEELGCPALSAAGEVVQITDRCRGCGLCALVCPAGAIEGVVGVED